MSIKIAYAGNREISVKVLSLLLNNDVKPEALFIPEEKRSSHSKELLNLCNYLRRDMVFIGDDFRKETNIEKLKRLNLDYIISIHFPYIFPKNILDIPKHGILNLHPSYLPYNRCWHTPTWAIEENTPFGATLHFMDEGIDTGDIVHQKPIKIKPEDTAHSLYLKVKDLEYKVFEEALPCLIDESYSRSQQTRKAGTCHKKKDLKKIQELDLQERMTVEKVIRRLRALTTNKISEAAYFKKNDERYYININIIKEKNCEGKQ